MRRFLCLQTGYYYIESQLFLKHFYPKCGKVMETSESFNPTPSANARHTDDFINKAAAPTSSTFASQNMQSLQEVKEAVYRLLKYAISDAKRNVEPALIDLAIPILHKEMSEFTLEDEKSLWNIYNQLSHLVTPATNESLWLKEQIERDDRALASGNNNAESSFSSNAYKKIYESIQMIGTACCIIFFLLQAYTMALCDSLEQTDHYYAELLKIDAQILATKQAKPDIVLCASPLKELVAQQEELLFKVDSDYQVIRKLSLVFWGYLFTTDTLNYYREKPQQCHANSTRAATFSDEKEHQARAERATFFEAAQSTLRICNYLMLPFILGTLGSVAYVIRSILDSFAKASLTLGSNRSDTIRVYLGGVLGLISGVIIAPDVKEIQHINYSPLVWAFLMGYSVEFAFSFFDALIARGRNALQALKAPTPEKETAEKNVAKK